MVLRVNPVHDIAYFDAVAADAKRLVDRARRTMSKERKAARDGLGYYDHGAEDGVGIFTRLRRGDPDSPSLFAACESGAVAETLMIRRLAARRHPKTGSLLRLKHQRRWLKNAQKLAQQVVGYDIRMSAPKDVSVLWGLASPDLRALLSGAHHRAVERVLAFIRDNGLIITRSGQDGHQREVVSDALIAGYFHKLSRDNDPQLHSHCVLINLCQRADGSVGTVDSRKIVAFANAMTELYRVELASILTRELGLAVIPEQHGFGLPAIPKQLREVFSKRRTAIVAEAQARGFVTANDRKAAQRVSYDTRRSKSKDITADTMTPDWHAEARLAGHDPSGFMPAIEAAVMARLTSPADSQDHTTLDESVLIETAFAHHARLSWPDLLAEIARQMQSVANADEVIRTAETLQRRLVRLPGHDQGEPVFTTPSIILIEHDLLKRAVAGRSRWAVLDRETVEQALEAFPTLSREQHHAVRHALNRDRIAVVNGSAGTGKSHMSRAISRLAEGQGLRVIGTSAAWTAALVLQREAGISLDNTFSLTKLIAAIDKGAVVLDRKTVLLVDEAGMAPLTAIADLVRRSDEAGAKIILVGDVRQLKPVASGAPMRALGAELGFVELLSIRRQHHGWMREASVELAAHRPDRAIDAYDRAGDLAVHVDNAATLKAAADLFCGWADAMVSPDDLREQLLVTSRNRDVAQLNRLVRDQLQAKGRIGPDVVSVRVLPRGRVEHSEPTSIPLAIGDRIVFGARLELGSRTIVNSDVARILAIDVVGFEKDPRLTFVLDRTDAEGQPLSFMVHCSQLISKFSEAGVPQFQHAYAMTVHGSQGATVDRAILVDTGGCSMEATYVGMTRHRQKLSVHISAEKSLSRSRREVVRLSRNHRLMDNTDPEPASLTLTEDERTAAIELAKARMRRPQPDPNPSFNIYDRVAWLTAADPVAEFKRQCERRGSRGGTGRLEPTAPYIVSIGDQTALSSVEVARLDEIPVSSDPVLKGFPLEAMPDGSLRHEVSDTVVTIKDGRPQWTASQHQILADRHSLADHPLVQMAVLILKKPLRWARAWVRRTFGLQGLNPLAASAHGAERQALAETDAVEADDRLPSSRASVAVDRDSREIRRQRRFARWAAVEAAMLHTATRVSTADQNRARQERRDKRFDRWASLDTSQTHGHAMNPGLDEEREETKRQQDRLEVWTALDRVTVRNEQPELDQDQLRERSIKRRQRWERWRVLDAGASSTDRASELSAEPKGDGNDRLEQEARQSNAGLPFLDVATGDQIEAEADPTRDVSEPPAHVQSAYEGHVRPASADNSALASTAPDSPSSARLAISAQTLDGGLLDRKTLMEVMKNVRRESVEKLDQVFRATFNAARGNPLDRREFGDAKHMARVNALPGEFEALKTQLQNDFGEMIKLQLSDLKNGLHNDLSRFEGETIALANLYLPLIPTMTNPFKRNLPNAATEPSDRGSSPREVEALLAMVLGASAKSPPPSFLTQLAKAVEPYIAAPNVSARVLCARALIKVESMDAAASDSDAVKAWAQKAGGAAIAMADALLSVVAVVSREEPATKRIAPSPNPVALKGRDPAGR